MTIPTITPLSAPPRLGQDTTEFDNKADTMVSELPGMVAEINATTTAINDYVSTSVATIDYHVAAALQSAANSLSVLNFGLLSAVIIGDTDGVNKVFQLLGIGFTPSWILFSDGLKIHSNDFTRNGSELTFDVAPASGVEVEALGPADPQRASPENHKGLSVITNKNGTFTGAATGYATAPTWRVEGQADEVTATFTYTNDGSYKYIHCFINDDSPNTIIDFQDQGVILIDAEYGLSLAQVKFRGNLDLISARGMTSIDSMTSLHEAWYNNDLTSFPRLDSSAVTTFYSAWYNNDLTSFPLIDSSAVTTFAYAWQGNDLTSFPRLDSSAVTTFYSAWRFNNLITFPAGFFDSCSSSSNYDLAFFGNALSETAVNDILISINTSGAENTTIGLNGGTNATPTGAGLTAKTALESRGCTVNVN